MPPASTEGMRVEIDGDVYELLPWAYKDGQRWAFRLVRSIAPAVADHGSNGAALAAILEHIAEEDLVAFSDVCEQYTNVVTEDGRVLPLKKIAATHMRGKYFAMTALMKAHGEAQFGSFFGRLAELLGGAGKTKGS